MQFKGAKGIYLQIAETLMDRLLGAPANPPGEDRFPPIRDTASEFGVNPNTVGRSYALLQERGILRNQRGIGYFVDPSARDRIIQWKKEAFLKDVLPEVFQNMNLLNLSFRDLRREYEFYNREKNK
ncbi:MAG: GntR family transcriptional regulator [Spirochaetales bacterium]|jgi:DNA-binding transcriptional regulator YhcF (GntR family)|nr:GntR family transcriptional regulator [Spirochaetales bacterium]